MPSDTQESVFMPLDPQQNVGFLGMGPIVQRMTRKRYMELVAITNKVCDMLRAEGVEPGEGCFVRRIAEEMWLLE